MKNVMIKVEPSQFVSFSFLSFDIIDKGSRKLREYHIIMRDVCGNNIFD